MQLFNATFASACSLFGLLLLVLIGSSSATSPARASSLLQSAQQQAPALPATRIARNEQLFMTGYEPSEMTATPPAEVTWMVFQNTSALPAAQPWPMSVFYESPGNVNDRFARITDDPTGANNKVLHYWLKNAVIPAGYQNHTKGRIQTGFSAPLVNAVEVFSRERLYIHPDMNLLLNYPASGNPWWIGILLQEYWSGANWLGDAFPSRISLTMVPYAGALRLQLRCHSANTSAEYWSEFNAAYALPVGEWITLEMGYKMGDAASGRMVLVIERESTGARTTVFDVTDWTYDPLADGAGGPGPRPLTHWNAQKLYTSDNVIHFIRDSGGVAQLYWDDFGFGDSWPPAWP